MGQLITKRIGVETFVDKLAEVSKHELYSKALKHPQVRLASPTDLRFDPEFCRLYKGTLIEKAQFVQVSSINCYYDAYEGLEGTLAKAVAPASNTPSKVAEPSEAELKAVAKYKDVIREQDGQIQHLRQRLAALEGDHITSQVNCSSSFCEQLFRYTLICCV